MSSSNKNRLYLAFYDRTPSVNNPLPYHVAILWKRKDGSENWRYHAINTINPKTCSQEWQFRPENIEDRTSRLHTLCLLGKTTMTNGEIEAILGRVRIVQGDPNWRCPQWVEGALQALGQIGVIEVLPRGAAALYDMGVTITNGKPLPSEKDRVPTFDVHGRDIASEVK